MHVVGNYLKFKIIYDVIAADISMILFVNLLYFLFFNSFLI